MVCNNGGIYGFLGAWWVLINMVPCNINRALLDYIIRKKTCSPWQQVNTTPFT